MGVGVTGDVYKGVRGEDDKPHNTKTHLHYYNIIVAMSRLSKIPTVLMARRGLW